MTKFFAFVEPDYCVYKNLSLGHVQSNLTQPDYCVYKNLSLGHVHSNLTQSASA
jgi:hypothetical protein